MIDQTRVFRALESASHQLDVKAPREVKLLVSLSLYLVVCLFMMPGAAAAQAPQKEYAQNYQEPFKGQPQKAEDFALLGADAGKCVKFEPEGLRITLPAGKNRAPTGVATAFGVTGDFEITVRYEILEEPEPADAGTPNTGTRISLTVNLNRPHINEASIRRKVTPSQPPHILTYRSMRKDADSKADNLGNIFPVKEKTGRFRLVRTGADLAYYLSEGLDKEFTFLTTHPFGADDLKDVQIFGQTSSPKAALDVRFTDLRISAASLPRKAAPPKIEKVSEPQIPTKDYAQMFYQSFKGSGAIPAGWELSGEFADQHVQFEQAGLRITLPPDPQGKRLWAGARTAFGVKGDFEITLSFEILKEPEPADVGKSGTRLTLDVFLDTPLLDTPDSEVANLSRSMTVNGQRKFVNWMRTHDQPKFVSHGYSTPATTGRLRLLRSGDELYFLASAGADQSFTFLNKYRFGADDLKRVGINGSTSGAKAWLDARVTDLRIRADGIPGSPASAPPPDPQQPALAPRERGKSWLVAGLVIGLAIILGLVFALAARFVRKRGGADARAK